MTASSKSLFIAVADGISENVNGLMKCTPTSILNLCPCCVIVQRRGNLSRFLSSLNTSKYVNINILKEHNMKA